MNNRMLIFIALAALLFLWWRKRNSSSMTPEVIRHENSAEHLARASHLSIVR